MGWLPLSFPWTAAVGVMILIMSGTPHHICTGSFVPHPPSLLLLHKSPAAYRQEYSSLKPTKGNRKNRVNSASLSLATSTRTKTATAAAGAKKELSSSSSNTSQSEPRQRLRQQQRQRQPWDVFRFVQQSSQFVNWNPLQQPTPNKQTIRPGDVLWSRLPQRGRQLEATRTSTALSFAALDDVVMGGVSASTFDNAAGLWQGTVTDANNGGFIGFRSKAYPGIDWDMRRCNGLELQVELQGDSSSNSKLNENRFKVGLRDSTDFNGIVWTRSVDVPKKKKTMTKLEEDGALPTTIRVPFGKLIPTQFARIVPNQQFNKENVVGLQFVFSKFEYDGDLNPKFELGTIQLKLLQIRAF